MKNKIVRLLGLDINEEVRKLWLQKVISDVPAGLRILDAGAGELRNKPLCTHLEYVSQDFCQYEGLGDGEGLQAGNWSTDQIDIVSDITAIPERDASFDIVLCSEVFEHLPDALKALDEFARLLKPGGKLIITAPFASLVHFAPYHYVSGFSRYWYEHHLPIRGFEIRSLEANGDWFSYCRQEMVRLPSVAKHYGDWCWPLAYLVSAIGLFYFLLRSKGKRAEDLACFGWHCVAIKN